MAMDSTVPTLAASVDSGAAIRASRLPQLAARGPPGMLWHMAEQHYLAGLDLAGRRVVVVGGGTVAQRRLPRLIAAGAAVELISPSVTPAVQAMIDAGELSWLPRRYAPGDLEGAWYVLCCTSHREVNAAVSAY